MKEQFRRGFFFITGIVFITVFYQFTVDVKPVNSEHKTFKPSMPPFLTENNSWADSVLASLTIEEKIGQLFMVAAYPKIGEDDIERVTQLIREQKVGGIIFFQGDPQTVSRLTHYYQSISKVPLLFAIDGEWGASMRISGMARYPRQMMLGAIEDNALIYNMGQNIARELKLLGIHINFAPVIDINNNPRNPVISSRSFGEQREKVTIKGLQYMKGMQDEGIMAVAKHFPGHGDTDVDSHLGLPVINHSNSRLDSIELFPFRSLIAAGVSGIMVAHLSVPSLDTTYNLPATLSQKIVDSLLKCELNFKGLVFTDAMGMKGVADLYVPEKANLMALLAGNDILLMPEEEEATIEQFTKMIRRGELSDSIINLHCYKVLQAKSWAVLPTLLEERPVDKLVIDSVNSLYTEMLRRQLVEKAITVVKDSLSLIPFLRLDTCRFAAVSLGGEPNNPFYQSLARYTSIATFHFKGQESNDYIASVLDSLKQFNLVILSLHSDDLRVKRNFGISDRLLELADALLYNYPVVLNDFGSPYLLNRLNFLTHSKALIVSYENDTIIQDLSAQLLFGAIGAEGRLPVGIKNIYAAGDGISTPNIQRLKYTLPLEAGMDAVKLLKIDSLAENAIQQGATPGCQILAARNGKVFWEKSYGYYDYRHTQAVENTDLYDIASVTKITATVPTLMYLNQMGIIDPEKPLSQYLPELNSTNKSKILIKDILLHQAGLEPWIPFYTSVLEPVYPDQDFYGKKISDQYPIQLSKGLYVNKQLKFVKGAFSTQKSDSFPHQVANGLYMSNSRVDSLFAQIYRSKLNEQGTYEYSDLGFYLFYKTIEKITHQSFSSFVDSLFYKPLGAYTLGYNPLNNFPVERIAPTENDLIFRRQLIQGYVHDPGAAMMGGVSGHAGLFSTANDLAKMMQMLLNGGYYGGKQYLNAGVIEQYTRCVACENGNRRGLGFDKPEPDTTKPGPAFKGISTQSYGHSGFTGTMTWMDPTTGILYIFLSNRVYPDAMNNKLVELNVRTNIQQAIYEAIIF